MAAAVAACPAVAGLHAGPVGSYLPGDRVPGVSVGDGRAKIVVDLAYPATVTELETQVRAALRPLLDGPVDIEVADVVLPDEAPPVDGDPDPEVTDPTTGGPTTSTTAMHADPATHPSTFGAAT